ncbi:DNA helicase [Tanacetum coccineum]
MRMLGVAHLISKTQSFASTNVDTEGVSSIYVDIGSDIGGRFILPRSFTGGPRYMYSHYLDALAICRVLVLYTIEFLKRGLPHCHTLLWVKDKIQHAQEVDQYISVELPNPEIDPEGYKVVFEMMVHGPCNPTHKDVVCMKEVTCSKKFLKKYNNKTYFDKDGHVSLPRRIEESVLKYMLLDEVNCAATKDLQSTDISFTIKGRHWEKPFLWKVLINALRSEGKIVLAAASSDIMDVPDKVFGGKSVVLGGDFSQTLPVKKGGSKAEIITASIDQSHLWSHFKVYTLTDEHEVELHNRYTRQPKAIVLALCYLVARCRETGKLNPVEP